jgi:2-aminoethylphosphonate-pyruvate transaminase
MVDGNIDFLVGSSNKCIQSVPGFAFVVCNKEKLLSCKDNSMSLSLDLYDQYTNMKNTKQFRFTPPVQSLLAFRQALKELEEEGGSSKRYERYCLNHKILRDGLLKIGFKELLPYDQQSKIISSFYYPKDKKFNFEVFYNRLSQMGN